MFSYSTFFYNSFDMNLVIMWSCNPQSRVNLILESRKRFATREKYLGDLLFRKLLLELDEDFRAL